MSKFKASEAKVEQRGDCYVVLVRGEVAAGPFLGEAQAWRWIDHHETFETWERKTRPTAA